MLNMFNVHAIFFIAVVQLLCEIVCRASVNKDVYCRIVIRRIALITVVEI